MNEEKVSHIKLIKSFCNGINFKSLSCPVYEILNFVWRQNDVKQIAQVRGSELNALIVDIAVWRITSFSIYSVIAEKLILRDIPHTKPEMRWSKGLKQKSAAIDILSFAFA